MQTNININVCFVCGHRPAYATCLQDDSMSHHHRVLWAGEVKNSSDFSQLIKNNHPLDNMYTFIHWL